MYIGTSSCLFSSSIVLVISRLGSSIILVIGSYSRE
jgi:hypothetical protein